MNSQKDGLPTHLFEYVSSITPMINVDLLVHDPIHGIMLSWRNDKYYGPGWHIPGGIIRFKENVITRLRKVAILELNTDSLNNFQLECINQIMNPSRDVRGHFISFLYSAKAVKELISNEFVLNQDDTINDYSSGTKKWHKTIPDNLIKQHRRYIEIMKLKIDNRMNDKINLGNLNLDYTENDERQY
ncbi:NUDIX hydrolase [bacterium]|nr:NUDIX hydrolase [bacterium]|tara:strand:- start:6533 stop:7093 length:561 start_codon:yes stop_codon:yes gene_type:complete